MFSSADKTLKDGMFAAGGALVLTQEKKILKRRNASATALRSFVRDTAHIVFIHIPSVVKAVHIFMTRNRVPKSCLIAELCFCHFVFLIVFLYVFGFHHKQSASD